jgi:DNA-binding MarR family transcriptional regulator
VLDPSVMPEALTDRVAFLLRLALVRAETLGEQALTELGISGREYGILALLERGPTSTQRQLGASLGVDRTTTVALLSGLQARGLISRLRDPGNRRAHQVALTDAGEELRGRAAAALTRCDERFLAPLPADQRSQLRVILLNLL